MKRTLSLITTVVLLLGLLAGCETGDQNSTADVQLSEVMASNNGVLADNEGDYPDWIELYNPTDEDINLEGYGLTDDTKKKGKFTFPEMTIAPGEYLVIYASGKNMVDAANRIVHLPYSINSKQEDVQLYDPHGKLLGHIVVNNLAQNKSIGLNEKGETVYFVTPTPGAANSETEAPPVTGPVVEAADAKLYINEYSTKNAVTLADADGDFGGWAELYNYGDKDLNLSGFTLSDDPSKPDKWTFPAVTVPAGGYQVVFLSGKGTAYTEGGELHADFSLSGKEEKLSLYAGDGKPVDELPVYDLTSNLSYGRTSNDPEKCQFFAKATPGAANTLPGFDSIDSAKYPQNKTVVFSETAAVNTTYPATVSTSRQPARRSDYIELYNPTDKPVSLSGYRLSKKQNTEKWHTLPDVTIEPGAYLLILCGADRDTFEKGVVTLSLGISRYGQELYLLDPDGVAVDSISTGRMAEGTANGRVSMTDDKVYCFETQTPGQPNPAAGLGAPAPTPVFSKMSGYAESGETVTISCPGAVIRYTTDGSTPTTDSPVYDGTPISITQTVTIRARAYMEGRMPSDDSAGSYIVGRRHDMPVMFLSTDPDNLFSEEKGILANGPGYTGAQQIEKGANYWKDWERPVHVEYVDKKGNAQLEFNAGIKVFGQYSRELKQKSLSINLRDRYGPTEVCYPFFKDGVTNVFSELVLRSSGQDNASAHIRDAFTAMAVKGQMDLDIMDYQPVVVYINGEYFGFYDLRDKICEDYVANRTGADPDNIDMIKGNSIVMSGSMDAYKELLNYVSSHDLRVEENYRYVCSQVDIEELMNWWIVESFFNNTDTGNIKFYRERTEGAKWRWVLFDMDWALSPSTYEWNMVDEPFNPKGHGVGKMFSTTLMRGLIANEEFRTQYIKTFGKYLRTTFATDRLLELYDRMIAEIETEMPYHIERWGSPSSMNSWKNNVQRLREIIEEKTDLTWQNVIKSFSNRSGSYIPDYLMSAEEVEALMNSEPV